MSSYCCWVIGMTICLAPRGTCVEGVFRSRSTCRVFGRESILASPSLERSRMTKMPPAGYPAFLQYLQSGRVRTFHSRGQSRMAVPEPVSLCFHVTCAETQTNNLGVSLDTVPCVGNWYGKKTSGA